MISRPFGNLKIRHKKRKKEEIWRVNKKKITLFFIYLFIILLWGPPHIISATFGEIWKSISPIFCAYLHIKLTQPKFECPPTSGCWYIGFLSFRFEAVWDQTSNNVKVITFLCLKTQGGKLWKNAVVHVLYTFIVGRCLGVLGSDLIFWTRKLPNMYPPIFL